MGHQTTAATIFGRKRFFPFFSPTAQCFIFAVFIFAVLHLCSTCHCKPSMRQCPEILLAYRYKLKPGSASSDSNADFLSAAPTGLLTFRLITRLVVDE